MRALIPLLVAVFLTACGGGDDTPVFVSADITGADYARDFSLTGHDGKPRRLADFRGKAVAVFFGFTHCPDVCPTALAAMAQVMRLLGADGAKLQVLFISVDPERDTPALLAQYVPAFDASFIGLTGTPEAIARTAQDFRVYYRKNEGETAGSYTLDHSAGTFLFDPQGRLRLYVKPGERPETIAADLRQLIAGR